MNNYIKVLENDGVIAFPTDTVWGLGCLVNSKKAVDKIYEIKGRDRSKPLILMSSKIEYLMPYVENISEKAKDLMTKYYPGAITLIFKKSKLVPNYIVNGKNTVGIRIPDCDVFTDICKNIKTHVLATTSANISNEPASISLKEVENSLGNKIDYIVRTEYKNPQKIASTVALAIDENIKVLRQGNIYLD